MNSAQTTSTLRISVLHGDLNHTNYPILIGHYEGDTIAGVERVVDGLVDRALSRRYHLGRYPGKPGTVAVMLDSPNDVQRTLGIRHGAIVIGLGKWGELTPSTLTQAVSQGVMEYCLHIHQCQESASPSNTALGLTINSLLIGSNTSANIAVEDSVNAIVRGAVLANRALAERTGKEPDPRLPCVTHVQFIERLLDVAIDAAKSTHRVVKRIKQEFQTEVQVEPYLKKGQGGQTRLVPSSTKGYWRRWTVSAVQEVPPPSMLSLPAVLKDRLRAMLKQEQAKDAQVYNALLDLVLQDRDPKVPPPYKLHFLALSDRARAEVTIQDNQPELITKLIQRTIATAHFRQDVAKTLFELLIPPDLKDSLRSQDNVVLVLDEVTANYPWELMIDTDEPLCVRMGMIRQLQTVGYETRARDTTSRNALVVGNPLAPSNYPDLPGAMEEAKRVAALLEKADYETEYTSNRLGAGEVLNQLFARPYRIIHIAGHGYYRDTEVGQVGDKAGVVLNDGIFLTAAEIAMMDPIPELVFLNCCHLGRMGGTAYNKMAASIARELIRKGVRAVVAAGWPVQDEAAWCFAEVLYKVLLEGKPFGVALKNARQETWRQFQDSNTWGAYQAYGDPDFCLTRNDGTGHSHEDDATVAVEEVLTTLDGILPRLNNADQAQAREALNRIEKQCAPDWLELGHVQERLGAAYGERGLFKEAIAHYKQAAESADISNPATLRAIEQWINFAVRCADTTETNGMTIVIEEAIARGNHLLAIAKTSERLSIMGSAYKRLARSEHDQDRVTAHLEKAAAYYREAAERQQQEGRPDPYPLLNEAVLEALLGKMEIELEPLLSRCESLAQQRFQKERNTWDAVTLADVALIRAFTHRTLQQEQRVLTEQYQCVFEELSANPKEQQSVLSQMKFVSEMLEKVKPWDEQTVTSCISSLNAIHEQLHACEPNLERRSDKKKPAPQRSRGRQARAKRTMRKTSARKSETRRPARRSKRTT